MITGKNNVLPAIIVKVGDSHSPAVVDVFVSENIKAIGFFYGIDKVNPRFVCLGQFKKCLRLFLAGGQQKENGQTNGSNDQLFHNAYIKTKANLHWPSFNKKS